MGNRLDMKDFVGAGFERLDDKLIEQHPPKIQWGQLYRDMTKPDKIRYLERVACAMNHAAAKIQGERDGLITLISQKEEKLKQMAHAVRVNQDMLQREVTRMNEDKQNWLAEAAKLRNELRAAQRRVAELEAAQG